MTKPGLFAGGGAPANVNTTALFAGQVQSDCAEVSLNGRLFLVSKKSIREFESSQPERRGLLGVRGARTEQVAK